MYLSPEKVQVKDVIAFAYANGLSITPKADVEKGGEDSASLVQRSMMDVRSEDNRHVQAGVIPDDK